MFRPEKAFVTIITARKGLSGHYGLCGTGVGCHFWAVAVTQAPGRRLVASQNEGHELIDVYRGRLAGVPQDACTLDYEWPGSEKG